MDEYGCGIGSIAMMLFVVAVLFLGPLGMGPLEPPPGFIFLIMAFVLVAIFFYLSHASK
ncbi:hypothetical protein COLO4_31939 [Corchorus olitorius]|uniref:Transmembrane protein n=1 Tax=Corchorus olitorius TaxID=93759 RepID=A0A1R3H2V2_9ROSI|nr:hypothetical protein COLO4_31939 [Corchorus olitorius]